MKLVRDMDSALGAEGVLDAIFKDVADFIGDAKQYDDMTVVVMRVES